MKAVGLDTSVVVRLLTGMPESQARSALAFLKEMHAEKSRAVVSDLVVAETYFALTYHYRIPKEEAMERITEFLESGFVSPDPRGAALETLKSQEKTRTGFVDQLIRNQYLDFTEAVATFDAEFGRMPKVRRLKA